MKFHNSLFMSVLLVMGYVCLNFYEAKISEELDAHNYVLQEMVEKQAQSIIDLIAISRSSSEKTQTELNQLDQFKSNYSYFKNVQGRIDADARAHIESLFEMYNINEKIKWDGKFTSSISQNNFYNALEEQIRVLCERIKKREKFVQHNNTNVIIKEREESYKVDEVYELDFAVVFEANEMLGNATPSYIINDQEFPLDYFPMEFSYRPDSIIFKMNGKDPVTGRNYKIKENHNFNLKILP